MNKLPTIFDIADQSARRAQRQHFSSLVFLYTTLVLASASTLGAEILGTQEATALYLLFVTLGILLLIRSSRTNFISKWYRMRAVAESIKTVSWKQAMSGKDLGGRPANKALQQAISKILSVHSNNAEVSELTSIDVQETPWMKEVRRKPVEDRFAIYIQERVREQLAWYESRSRSLKLRSKFFFGLLIIVHTLAAGLGFYQFIQPRIEVFWTTEPVLVVAAGILGWIEAKRYGELSTSYALTAQEIYEVLGAISPTLDDHEFSKLVEQTELVFSREHTQWGAR